MSVRTQRGFTLIEVMLSVVLLTVGVMALVGSAAMTGRMIGRGRSSTMLAQKSSSRFDKLRQIATSTSPTCNSNAFVGGDSTYNGIRETWTITTPAGTTNQRLITLILRYKASGRAKADTVKTLILCK